MEQQYSCSLKSLLSIQYQQVDLHISQYLGSILPVCLVNLYLNKEDLGKFWANMSYDHRA